MRGDSSGRQMHDPEVIIIVSSTARVQLNIILSVTLIVQMQKREWAGMTTLTISKVYELF